MKPNTEAKLKASLFMLVIIIVLIGIIYTLQNISKQATNMEGYILKSEAGCCAIVVTPHRISYFDYEAKDEEDRITRLDILPEEKESTINYFQEHCYKYHYHTETKD